MKRLAKTIVTAKAPQLGEEIVIDSLPTGFISTHAIEGVQGVNFATAVMDLRYQTPNDENVPLAIVATYQDRGAAVSGHYDWVVRLSTDNPPASLKHIMLPDGIPQGNDDLALVEDFDEANVVLS